MKKNKLLSFGFRGWMLMLWTATAMFAWVIIGNYPLNILGDLYGGSQTLSLVYTIASIVGIVVQIIVSSKAGRIKSWKMVSAVFGCATIASLLLIMLITPCTAWIIIYGLGTCISSMYGTWALSVLIGVWFPKRKGTVMGIVTFAFPIANAFLGFFATGYFSKFEPLMGQIMEEKMPDMVSSLIAAGTPAEAAEMTATEIITGQVAQQTSVTAFLPYLIVIVVGLVIGLIFIKDFPEQCGAFRDNDRNMTPEIAQEMMAQEEKNRKTTVWTTAHTMKTADFWLLAVPIGLLGMFAIGAMTQSRAIISPYEADFAWIGGYTGVMLANSVFGIIGSFLCGIIDTKLGTRKALIIAMISMIVAGILGLFNNSTMLLIGFLIVGMFMGASSNFTVSAAVQYWRIEDFPSVFSCLNPISQIFNAAGPTIIAILIATLLGTSTVFIGIGIAGIIGLFLCLMFRSQRVKKYDDRYREAAGKTVDDELVGRL